MLYKKETKKGTINITVYKGLSSLLVALSTSFMQALDVPSCNPHRDSGVFVAWSPSPSEAARPSSSLDRPPFSCSGRSPLEVHTLAR